MEEVDAAVTLFGTYVDRAALVEKGKRMPNVHDLVLRFMDFLNVFMPIATDVFHGSTNDLLADWLQANWEILVEARTGKYISLWRRRGLQRT